MSSVTNIPQQSIERIVEAAVLAPSADNNQPWRFRNDGRRLEVYLDLRRSLPSDVNRMFDLTAIGAAIENAVIAGSHFGFKGHVTYENHRQNDDNLSLVATIDFRENGSEPDALYDQLAMRCTCRKPFSRNQLPQTYLSALTDSITRFAEVQIHWLTDRRDIGQLATLVGMADRIRFEHQPFHAELYRQLRFTSDECDRTRDGLDVRTLELPPGAKWMLHFLRKWSRLNLLNRIGLSRLLAIPSMHAVRNSGALGILTVSRPNSQAFIVGGRALERVWLSATANGLAFHPLGSIPIFLAQSHLDERNELRHLSKFIASATSSDCLNRVQGRTIQLVFRLGFGELPTCRSARRPAKETIND